MSNQPHRRARTRRWLLVALLGIVAGALAPVVTQAASARPAPASQEHVSNLQPSAALPAAAAAKPPKEGDVRGHRRILLVTYALQKPCVVQANYPLNPGGRQQTVTSGKIIWRYNVSRTVAAVAIPGANFPNWGFVTDRTCIGKSTGQTGSYQIFHNGHWVTKATPPYPAGQPVPNRILSGRSQFKPYWKHVDWRPSHGAIPAAKRRLGHNATLRDAANQFVIGNVYASWQVRPTSQHSHGMTKVYVPALHRWGWLAL